ncbi:MAG: hypothetical protein ACLTLY_02955 [Agathobacter rectalis]
MPVSRNRCTAGIRILLGLYYQPKEPDKMREFEQQSKRNDI